MIVFKNTALYASASMLSQLASFLILPLYAASLSIEDFAIVSMIELYMFVFVAISSLSISRATQRFFFDRTVKKRAFNIATAIILVWGGFVSLLLLLLVVFFKVEFYQLGLKGVCLICLIGVGQNVSTLAQVFFQVHQKPFQYCLFVLFKVTMLLCSVYVLMVWKRMEVMGYLYSQIVTYSCLTLYALVKIRPNSIFNSIFNVEGRKLSKLFVLFSLPYVPTVFSQWVMSMSGRLILEKTSESSDVAVYALGYKLSTAVFLVSSAISMTMVPIIFKNLSETSMLSDSTNSIIKCGNFMIAMTGTALIIFSKDLFTPFFDVAYDEAFNIVSLLVVAHYISGFMGLTSNNYLSFFKKTTIQMSCFLVSASIYLCVAFVLTPDLQVYGVVISSISSMSILFILHVIVISKFNLPKINFNDFSLGLFVILAASIGRHYLSGSIWSGDLNGFIMKLAFICMLGIYSFYFMRIGGCVKMLKSKID